MYPSSLERLIESFRLLPGVGAKSAERYALCMIDASEEEYNEALFLLEKALGQPFDPMYYVNYLKNKYSAIYNL